MAMFWEFFTFELRFRWKSVSTYVYFLLWFFFSFLCVASENFGPVGNSNGKVLLNGPYANTYNDVGASLFGVIVIAAIFGTSILRDFQRDTFQILFTKPISKFAYLGGRWAGSFVTTVFAFSGMVFGTFFGTFAPWADHSRIAPNQLWWWYLQPFLSINVIQIFFLGSIFFAVSALTRKVFIVYLQGVAIFMVYLILQTVFSATRSLEHFWSGIFDPVGLRLLNDITRYWTVVEKNSLLLPWDFSGNSPGVFLYNRLLWTSIGAISLGSLWALFPMSVEALTAKSQGRRAAKARLQDEEQARPARSLVTAKLPRVHQRFGMATSLAQYVSLTRLRIRTILSEIPFWAIVGLLIVFAVNNGQFAGRAGDERVWPVTYLMLQAVEGGATLFFYIVATLYAAELVWRERDNRFDGIHDALPMQETTDWLAKFTAIGFVEVVLLAVTMLVGMTMQTIAGYYHYEVVQYLKELYVVTLPQVLGFTLLALFVQTMVSNKFVGHGIVIGVFVLQPIMFSFGWENTLYLPGGTPPYTYSDMNGYGHFVPALFWSITYWSAIFAFLGVISIGYTRRGAEESLHARTRQAVQRLPRLVPIGLIFALLAIGSGVWYYYNAHVLNVYTNAKAGREIQAQYERENQKYKRQLQLKVISADLNVDLFPERRSFSGSGRFVLQNKYPVAISQIHISDAHPGAFGAINIEPSVSNISFNRPFHVVSVSSNQLYTIYQFDTPIAPRETVAMTFNVGHTTRGFRDGHESPEFAYSGTFFDNSYFPNIGYDTGVEIQDPRRRREEHLGELELLPPRGDPWGSYISVDYIKYHTTVSTSDSDNEGKPQIAISPGYLQTEWHQNGRHYFTYDMGDVPMAEFFNFNSARYVVTGDVYQGVNGPIQIDVYHLAAHTFDVEDMIEASKASLAYYEKNFSPYQFRQYRILEYPRYRGFAQSFPNTIPFSEAIGFIDRVEKPKDIDFAYFVTAHEFAHQWWGHQLIGGNVEGSNMMSESLAEYSALRVMEKKYGDDNMRRFLSHELDGYLRGRSGEIRHENPLVLVQNETYVWYQKGSLVLYALSDYIGEDKLNLALHNFLLKYRYANAGASQVVAYPDTRQFVDALRAATPPEYQYYITDAFENIVLYDNKALSAKWEKMPDGKYKVTLAVQARKLRADGNGAESPMKMDDYVDIGIFNGKKEEEKPLYLKREKITREQQTFIVIVDQQPSRAGIDPYNKLIDRIADDNMIDVTTK